MRALLEEWLRHAPAPPAAAAGLRLVALEPLGKAPQAVDRVPIRLVSEPTDCRLYVAKGFSGQTAAAAGIQVARDPASIILPKLSIEVGLQ